MAKLVVNSESLVSVADAIREKGGTNESLTFPQGFIDAVNGIESGSGEDDFIGIKYSNYSGGWQNLPKTADARSLDLILVDPNSGENVSYGSENGRCLSQAFYNQSVSAGYFIKLEEVYMPTKVTTFNETFTNCGALKKLYGDLPYIETVSRAFYNCKELTEIPFMPNLKGIDNQSFAYCTGLTTVTLPNTIERLAANAFNNCTNLTNIYVPWAEGAVANAPWGATNATIHYNSEV